MFFTVPINENGLIIDPYIGADLIAALDPARGVTDVFVYSHGWWTNAAAAASDYNRFAVGLAGKLAADNGRALAIGLHWPSMLDENNFGLLNLAQALSYYTMEHRADAVGEHAGSTLLAQICAQASADRPLRIHLIGHSFGCKVICSSLCHLATPAAASVQFNVVLLQAAFEHDLLEASEQYADLLQFPGLRVLATTSPLDLALRDGFPRAAIVNVFGKNKDRFALGSIGPSPRTVAAWGDRLQVLDLAIVHQANPLPPPAGNHSDIFRPMIYDAIAAFIAG